MKRYGWQIGLGLVLTVVSSALYVLLLALGGNASAMRDNLLSSLAFLPVQVFIWTLITNGLLGAREHAARVQKLNMVVGAFYSEVGLYLLGVFSAADERLESLRCELLLAGDWTVARFAQVQKQLHTHTYAAAIDLLDLNGLRTYLLARRSFMLGLLENQALLEHEAFTDLLWAVFHLSEELEHRPALDGLPSSDYAHLQMDINRAYARIVYRWLDHMQHLRTHYPYLFSLALRLNPFDRQASVVVEPVPKSEGA